MTISPLLLLLLPRHRRQPLFQSALVINAALVFTLLFFFFFFLIGGFHSPQVYCYRDLHQPPSQSPSYPAKVVEDALLVEEKIRLGSMPPSCHNKCNSCHPCMTVQVPTIPSHTRVEPGSSELFESYDNPPQGNRYSNYKPIGWKCRCGDHFYNP